MALVWVLWMRHTGYDGEGAQGASHNEAVQELACAQAALLYSQITQKCTGIPFSRLLTAEII